MGEKNNDRVCTVQFHQSYSYEDFIMGYRPDELGGFELQEGVFYRFCDEAKNDLRQHRIYRKNIGFKRKTPDK
jgi:5-methylcytosine-specific restriction protein B